MFKKDLVWGSVILFIGISILASGYFIGKAIESLDVSGSAAIQGDPKVLNLTQAADYLNMSEEEVRAIIQVEKNRLEGTGSFSGKMFPYFIINGKQYFYKAEIDEWLKDISSNHREYDTTKGWILP